MSATEKLVREDADLETINGARTGGGRQRDADEEAPDDRASRSLRAQDDATKRTHGVGGSEEKERGGGRTAKAESARFEGDTELEQIQDGSKTVGRGGRGLTVTKLQQALIDLGYLLPKYGVDGKFEGETRAALCKFQHDVGITETGEFDEDTITALDAKYDDRKPYVDRAAHDPAHPGTRHGPPAPPV